jgi:hypothetical protein
MISEHGCRLGRGSKPARNKLHGVANPGRAEFLALPAFGLPPYTPAARFCIRV